MRIIEKLKVKRGVLIILIISFYSVLYVGRYDIVSDRLYIPELYLSIFLYLLALIVVLNYFLLNLNIEAPKNLQLDSFDVIIVFYVIYLLAQLFVVRYTFSDRLPYFIFSLLLILFLKNYDDKHYRKNFKEYFAFILLLFSFSNVIYGLLQFGGVLKSNSEFSKISGSFFNPGIYAIWLTMSLPIYLYYLKKQNGACIKIFVITLVILTIFAIIFSMSRLAWLASIFIILFHTYIYKPQVFFRFKFVIKFLCLPLFLLLFYFLYTLRTDSIDGRFYIWNISITMFIHSPLVGIGLQGYERNIGYFLIDFFKDSNNLSKAFILEKVDYSFNDFLQLLVEQGVIGMAFFCVLIYKFFKNNITSIKENSLQNAFKLNIIIIISTSLFSYTFEIPQLWLMFCVLLGSAYNSFNKKKIIVLNKVTFTALLIFIFLTSILLIRTNINNFLAKIKSYKGSEYCQTGNYNKAIIIYKPILHYLYNDPTMLLPYAKALSENGLYMQSNNILLLAKKVSSDLNIFLIEGHNYSLLNRKVLAEKSFIKAILVDPKLMYSKYILARFYIDNKNAKAKIIANEILNMKVKVQSPASDQMLLEMKYFLLENSVF